MIVKKVISTLLAACLSLNMLGITTVFADNTSATEVDLRTNVALNKSTTESDAKFGGASLAVDGKVDINSKWCTDVDENNAWMEVNLGKNYDISKWKVQHAAAAGEGAKYNTKSFALQAYIGGKWVEIDKVSGNTDAITERELLGKSFTTYKVRLQIYQAEQATSGAVRIPEFEVYGVEATGGSKVLFEDNFDSYTVGTASVGSMKPGYKTVDGISVANVADSNNALKSNKSLLAIDVKSSDKTVQFDFNYSAPYAKWGGIYVKMYDDPVDSNDFYFSINPNFSSQLLISHGDSQIATKAGLTFDINKWYTCKSELKGEKLMLKVWEKGTDEPAKWDVEGSLAGFTPNAQVASFNIQVDPLGATNQTMIDNLTIETLDLSNAVAINVTSNDVNLGTVTGSGLYELNDMVTLKAKATPNNHFVNWTENGVEVSKEKEYTFAVTMPRDIVANFELLGEPQYVYFEDNYDSYDVGTVNKDKFPPKYISFKGDYNVVAQEGKGNVLAAKGKVRHEIDCSIVDKQVLFDFRYDKPYASWDGLYIKLHSQPNGNSKDEYYFSINPNFGSKNMIVSCNNTNLGSKAATFNPGTWYTCKSRIVENQIFLKVWDSSKTEPLEWDFSYPLSGFVPTAENTTFAFEQDDTTSGRPLGVTTLVDNFAIKTWVPLAEKKQYKIDASANDQTMGTVAGQGIYLEGNLVTLSAKANNGFSFVNWTKDGKEVSCDKNYVFEATQDCTVVANFEVSCLKIRSFMANGLTELAQINNETKTINLRFASDINLAKVRPYFYCEPGFEPSVKPYDVMDLSNGTVKFDGWTINAVQNKVMTHFYVDTKNGSNSNNGLTVSTAFKTIERAQEAVRGIDAWTGDVIVNIAKGNYVLDKTIKFDQKDSADKGYAVIYDGKDSKETVVSSGIKLQGWTESTDVPNVNGVYEIAVPKLPDGVDYSRDLFVDGRRADMAKNNSGSGISGRNTPAYGQYTASADKANMYSWRNPSDIEFVYEVGWCSLILPVQSISQSGDKSIIQMKPDVYNNSQIKLNCNPNVPTYIQGAFELLDQPNEWYFDRTAQKIYYIPQEGKNPNDMEVVLPTLEKLVEVNGTPADVKNGIFSKPVYGLTLKNLGFKYTSYIRPHIRGQIELQANFVYDEDMIEQINHDNFVKTNGGLTAAYVEGMRVDNCDISLMSAAGFDYEVGAVGSTITNSRFEQIGAAGIQVGGVKVRDAQPCSEVAYEKGVLNKKAGADPDRITEDILIFSNTIDTVGVNFKGSIGVFAGYIRDFTLAHNVIKNVAYTGVSGGWGWGMWDKGGRDDHPMYRSYYHFDTPSVQARYVFENNDISSCMQKLFDGGAIYTLSDMPGSIIRGNFIHDIPKPYGAIYLDEATGGMTDISENVVYNVNNPYFYHTVAQYGYRKDECEAAKHDNFFTKGTPTDPLNPLFIQIRDNAGIIVDEPDVPSEPANKLDLEALVEYTKLQMTSPEYKYVVPVVKKALESRLAIAQDILTDEKATQAQVDSAYSELLDIVHMLSYIGDNTSLKALYEVWGNYNKALYYKSTTDIMDVALVGAKSVLDNENSLQDDINNARKALINASWQLRKIPNKADLDELTKLISRAKLYNNAEFTAESFSSLETAIVQVSAVVSSHEPSQGEVTAAIAKLNTALDGLVRLTDDKTESPKEETDKETTDKHEITDKNNTNLPTTGDDATFIFTFALIMMGAGVTGFGLRKKFSVKINSL